ncbi:MAG: hypothetical protein U0Z53_00905 [Blastocatellia bacterium]
MEDLLFTLLMQFAITVAVMASAGFQDRTVPAPAAQQEWRFDMDQPDWKSLPEPDTTFTRAQVSRTAEALRVTIPEGKRRGSGMLGGAIYVDVPPLSVPFRVVVQARTSDAIRLMMVGINLSTSDAFQTWGDSVVPVSDGAVHTYEVFVWQTKDPVRQLGLWFRATDPGRIDILSIKFVRQARTDRWEYRGFAVDVASLDLSTNRDALLQALRRQFDIVAGAGLDQRTLDFFRSVPIVINPVAMADPTIQGSRVARYERGAMIIVPRVYNPEAPMFLHEFLHAYHDQKLPNGFSNPDILRLFKEASSGQAFPGDSYMMSNVSEYFAMAGSAYLYGTVNRDPFTRENVKKQQPALYQWFAKEFGPK